MHNEPLINPHRVFQLQMVASGKLGEAALAEEETLPEWERILLVLSINGDINIYQPQEGTFKLIGHTSSELFIEVTEWLLGHDYTRQVNFDPDDKLSGLYVYQAE